MDKKKRLSVIGAGKVGTAVASILASRSYEVVKVCDEDRSARGRAAEMTGARATADASDAVRDADIVLITTPDGIIEEVCQKIARSGEKIKGKKFVHMSGALSLGVLEPALALGAETFSIHPLQTFADIDGAVHSLPGSRFAVTCSSEGEQWARSFVEDLGGNVLMVKDSDKVLYHAAAVLACNLHTMLQYGAHGLLSSLEIEEEEARGALAPLVRATVDNIEKMGPASSLTGPLSRGDTVTLEAHLEALDSIDPVIARAYRAVSLLGLRLVEELGEVDAGTIEEMRDLLSGGKEEEGEKWR